jgi:hypothetical protein
MTRILSRLAVSTTATIALLGAGATAASADSSDHEATVVAIARTDTTPGIGTGLTRDGGVGSPLQNPIGGTPAGPQQITTQSSGGAIGVGVVAILVLGIVVFFRVKKHDLKVGDAVLVGLFGVALSGTVVGAMGDQITESAIASLGNVLGGL